MPGAKAPVEGDETKAPMYHEISTDMLALIEPVAQAHGVEIVDATVKRGRGRSQVRVVVDTPAGDGRVTVDTCARVSREIGHGLDALDLVAGSYTLEVCSPGVDRVLARPIDFERAVGQKVAVETREPLAGRRRFRGELLTFASNVACLRQEQDEFRIPLELIARAQAFHPVEAGAKR